MLDQLWEQDEEDFLLRNAITIQKDKELLLFIILGAKIINGKEVSYKTKQKIFGKEITFENIALEIKEIGESAYNFLKYNFNLLEKFYRSCVDVEPADFILTLYEAFDKDIVVLKIINEMFTIVDKNTIMSKEEKTEFILEITNLFYNREALIFLKDFEDIIKTNVVELIIKKMYLLDINDFTIYFYPKHINDEQVRIFKNGLEILEQKLKEEEYKKIVCDIFSKNKFLFSFLEKYNFIFGKDMIENLLDILMPVIKENYNNLEESNIKFLKKYLFELSMLDKEFSINFNKILSKYKKPIFKIEKEKQKILFKKIKKREKLDFDNLKNYSVYIVSDAHKNEEYKEIIMILLNEYGEEGLILINNLFEENIFIFKNLINIKTYEKIEKIRKKQGILFNL